MEVSQNNIKSLPQLYRVIQTLLHTPMCTQQLIEDSITLHTYLLTRFYKEYMDNGLVDQLLQILNAYNQQLVYNTIQPVCYWQQKKHSFQILNEVTQPVTLSRLTRKRNGLSEFQAKYYISQIYFLLNFLHRQNILLEYLSFEDIIVDKDTRPMFGFLMYARLNTSVVTFTKSFQSLIGCQLCPYSEFGGSWYLGMSLFQLLQGRPIIGGVRDKKQVVSGSIKFNRITNPLCKDLIKRLMQTDPTKRMPFNQLFKHQWMRTGQVIPRILPSTILYCPPSQQFRKEYAKLESKPVHRPSIQTNRLRAFQLQPIQKSQRKCKKSSSNTAVTAFKTLKQILGPQSTADYRVHVEDLCDISNVFGYGYRMSNGVAGFFFNDRTLLLQLPDKTYYYFDQNWQLKILNQQRMPDEYDLRKKNYILEAYRKAVTQREFRVGKPDRIPYQRLVYIKQYVKTKNSKLYLLSNDMVQAQFIDKTQIIVVKDQPSYYDDRKTQFRTINQSDCEDIFIREKYTRQLAKKLLGWGASWGQQPQNFQDEELGAS